MDLLEAVLKSVSEESSFEESVFFPGFFPESVFFPGFFPGTIFFPGFSRESMTGNCSRS